MVGKESIRTRIKNEKSSRLRGWERVVGLGSNGYNKDISNTYLVVGGILKLIFKER